MDFEKVLPIKTVNDLVKELRETTESEPEASCSCGNCTCK